MIRLVLFLCFFLTGELFANDLRRIYLNGVDISSATHQQLENVHLRIDGQGNLFIEAPHYEVSEENTYLPLSSFQRDGTSPEHRKMQQLPPSMGQVGRTERLQPLSKQVMPVVNKADTQTESQDTGNQTQNNVTTRNDPPQ